MTASFEPGHKYVARASEDGFVPLGHGPDESGVAVDPRDQGLVQNLISYATTGARDMNVGVGRMLPGTCHIKHHHPHGAEFYYFVKGTCVLHIDGVDVEAGPGMAVYIPAGAVHGMRNDSDELVELVYGFNRGDYTDVGLVYDE